MTENYTVEEIRDNLESLKNRLKEKGRDKGFWVVATRSDFKPIKIETKTKSGKTTREILTKSSDIKKYILDGNEQYYIEKKFANIEFWFNTHFFTNIKKYSDENYNKIKDEIICSIEITILKVDLKGKISTETSSFNTWICRINFTVEDMKVHKLKISDAESLMRYTAEKLVISSNMLGINYNEYKKLLIKALKKLKK